MSLVDHALERTFVMALVVAPRLLHELPDDFDGGSLADFQAIAVWRAVCNLGDRDEVVSIASVRDELEVWAGHSELTWYERPTEAWPRALVDTADLLAERIARDPASLPLVGWARSLQRLAAQRHTLVELDEDIVIEEQRTAA